MPVLLKRSAATALPTTWPRLMDCSGSPLKLVPARTPVQPLQVVPEQSGGYVIVSSERATLLSAFTTAAMARRGCRPP